jgi:hypothetical protein
MGLPPAPYIYWPEAVAWYLLGRHAVVALLGSLPPGARRMWVPSYFCFDVADYWKSFVEVITYVDDPRRAEPDWSALRPDPRDVVVGVNYFGVRSGEPWRRWREHNQCVLVEDHTHDPVSGWALRSNADYAFASLRKTLPVPDGGILWSPRGLPLPAGDGVGENAASALKLAAMLWKREYLDGHAPVGAKPTFLAWQREAESALERCGRLPATTLSRRYLSNGIPLKWRGRRSANTRKLLAELSSSTRCKPLFSDWPEDAAPLGAVLMFSSQSERDAMRERLRLADVYCPIHWPPIQGCGAAARELAERILTIPTDQRYGGSEMDKIASIVTAF